MIDYSILTIHFRMDQIDWHLWHSFAAACRTGSLFGGSRMQGATHPTISRQIAQ